MKKRSGFSLVEALIVVVIIVLLLAVASPSYLGWRANTRVAEAAERLARDIDSVRTEAKRLNTSFVFRVSSDGKSYTLKFGETDAQTVNLPDVLTIDVANMGTNPITFFAPHGTTDASYRNLTLSQDSNTSIQRNVRVLAVTGKTLIQAQHYAGS